MIVERTLKIIALSVGVTAFTLLAVFGFAIWVFIPLLPAAVIFGLVLYVERQRAGKPAVHRDTNKAA